MRQRSATARRSTSSGAANSAGQAVLNLARYAKKVVLLVRGERLEDSMSQYLVERIKAAENVEVRLRTKVVGASGDGHLEQLQLCDEAHNTIEEVATSWLFVFIGAAPRTDWLGEVVARDDKGFLLTGQELAAAGLQLAARAAAVRPRDQRPRRLRRGRRAARVDEAGRLGGRRGRDGGPRWCTATWRRSDDRRRGGRRAAGAPAPGRARRRPARGARRRRRRGGLRGRRGAVPRRPARRVLVAAARRHARAGPPGRATRTRCSAR